MRDIGSAREAAAAQQERPGVGVGFWTYRGRDLAANGRLYVDHSAGGPKGSGRGLERLSGRYMASGRHFHAFCLNGWATDGLVDPINRASPELTHDARTALGRAW